ncbi:uroporphyrinogen-III synthase [Tabrizicola sp.]|uniref:uroporphyrinogen-III synthase n=1 Tax=Tabrizicola sp. TaxID=2005166 RepID=UPI003F2B41E5
MTTQSIARGTPVLLTRPEVQSRVFAKALTKRFGDAVRPIVAPLMAPQFLAPNLPQGEFTAVIFTSIWGVAGAAQLGVHLPGQAFCVGRRTAKVAEAAGFDVRSAYKDADALVAGIAADRPFGCLLHLRGEDTTGDVAERLNSVGIGTQSLVVYRQAPQALSAEGADLLRASGDVILPLFSPRSAALFIEALPPEARASLHIAVISAEVAKAAAAVPHSALVIADEPDAESILKAVGKLLAAVSLP